jgi:DNA-binding MarR family transcriptional regulator
MTVHVGSAQARFLRHIGRNSRISQADLARSTETAPTLTGRALEPLVARGWVRRKRSLEDRREYILELTAAGQRARARVEEAREGVLQRITAALDPRTSRTSTGSRGRSALRSRIPGSSRSSGPTA